jgi:hypothetical protein
MSTCPNCGGSGLVCEWHPDKAWTPTAPAGVDSCQCGAGMPCPVCRPQRRGVGPDEAVAEAVQRAVDVSIAQVLGRRQ